jgi:hypothetical protein
MRARPIVTAACLALALTGCQKPTPGVTVTSGTHSEHLESTTFCRDGQTAAAKNCVEHLDRIGRVEVKSGEPIGIDVDKSVAEHGWIVVLTDARQRSAVLDSHYFSYTPDFSNGPLVNLEIRSLSRVANDAATTGVWKFQLVEQ